MEVAVGLLFVMLLTLSSAPSFPPLTPDNHTSHDVWDVLKGALRERKKDASDPETRTISVMDCLFLTCIVKFDDQGQ